MKVENISQKKYSTNFKAIKSIKCEGLYKKFPEEGKKLIQTFKENAKAMDFCKKYDVDIVFFAQEKAMNCVDSSINIHYKDPTKGFFKRLSDAICGNEDLIRVFGFGNKYNIKDSIHESTMELNEMITAQYGQYNKSGLLNIHIKNAEKNIEANLLEKAKKQAKTEEINKAKISAREQFEKDSSELEEMLSKLKDSTKKN